LANEISNLLKAVIDVRKTAITFETKLDSSPDQAQYLIPDYHARLKEKMRLLSRARREYNKSINK